MTSQVPQRQDAYQFFQDHADLRRELRRVKAELDKEKRVVWVIKARDGTYIRDFWPRYVYDGNRNMATRYASLAEAETVLTQLRRVSGGERIVRLVPKARKRKAMW